MTGALRDVGRQLVVVLDRSMCFGISEQADMADACGRQEREHGIDHDQAGPENADDHRRVAGELAAVGDGDGGGHLSCLGGEVAKGLVGGEESDLLTQCAELARTGVDVAQQRDLVVDQWMVDHGERWCVCW